MAEIKFCGLTRRDDAAAAVALGARYVGVIFAGGPRQISVDQAREVLADVPATVARVGVFGDGSAIDIARTAREANLDVVQLHAWTDRREIEAILAEFGGEVWPVVRVRGGELPPHTADAFAAGNAVLLDTLVEGVLGGSGVPMAWADLVDGLERLRTGMVVLAGGLRPDNVETAIAALRPDVVDVSSGVEQSPGIKDHERMRAFRDAVAKTRNF